MLKASAPKIKEFFGEDYTKISFKPDLAKFSMTTLDDDIVALFSRRAYDVAGTSHGVKVLLNGKRLPVRPSFILSLNVDPAQIGARHSQIFHFSFFCILTKNIFLRISTTQAIFSDFSRLFCL